MTRVVLALSLVACSSNHGTRGSPGNADASECTADPTYGSATIVANGNAFALTAAAIAANPSDPNQGFNGAITAEDVPAMFEIDLYETYGAFSEGSGYITTGTFELAGDDLSSTNCGICVQLWPHDFMAGEYFATGGTVTLTSVGTPTGSNVSMGTLSGSVANITFAAWDGSNDVPVGSCSSAIVSLSFSGALQPGGDTFQGAVTPTHFIGHRR